MGLNELYKCENCPEFHPVELDLLLRALTLDLVGKVAKAETDGGRPDKFRCYSVLNDILRNGSPNEVWRYFDLLDRNIQHLKASQGFRDLREEDCELYSAAIENIDSSYHVVKCMKTNQCICASKLKKMLRGQPFVWSMQYRIVELFTSEPSQQWMEIVQFNINVKPIWFTDSRVYQFPTQVVAVLTGIEDMAPWVVMIAK